MAESPVQLIRNTILRQLGISPQAARDNGIRTNWPDLKKQWSVTQGTKVLARGKLEIDQLQMLVEIDDSDEKFADAIAEGLALLIEKQETNQLSH